MTPTTLSRLRGAVVGGASALTGIGAHAAAQGMLPETASLLMVATTAIALGVAVAALPAARVLPALIGGQAMVHVLLVLSSGHHHDLLTAPMAAMHTVGTLAALLLLCGVELLVHAASALALRAMRLHVRLRPLTTVTVPAYPAVAAPAALVYLGGIGRRGPPPVQ
ncbi:hypothetical protein [Gordonia hydrophobica]|uniref:Uncharacterized protein n=1 Tax=Gordonia hydrophobica TaxID=40516 RepID=A0ABZ2U3G8_9ACTN|nr:hypothetical protein [Gordonia hydrophobica]MBM7366922.1 hypothetical protein [Gordonia hydrophobica]